ncbi:hypothetical protein BB559_006435 [Furculomyces boomerangus]|uniref:Fork-head domain-containing protein n=2 Tax=Harpellales TaxID=61421 RepID=A0A2T9Y2V0_9FUNG|nr:hypothetical protein BB559_006435 [Furculomyces boomerangus]PWA00747.1 hypothetical protein BB558_003184 [Smittium angustum]
MNFPKYSSQYYHSPPASHIDLYPDPQIDTSSRSSNTEETSPFHQNSSSFPSHNQFEYSPPTTPLSPNYSNLHPDSDELIPQRSSPPTQNYPNPLSNKTEPSQRFVQAYAKLEAPDFSYYIKELSVSIGRHTNSSTNTHLDLGPSKTISRKHAIISYNYIHQNFELQVLGKNGCFYNTIYAPQGTIIALNNRSLISIGEHEFTFLLPESAYTDHDDFMITPPSPYFNSGYNDRYNLATITPQRLNLNYPNRMNTSISNTSPTRHKTLEYAPNTPSSPTQTPTSAQTYRRTSTSDKHLPTILPSSDSPTKQKSRNSSDIPGLSKSLKKLETAEKPPYSYASLIAQAIISSQDQKLTLNGIYSFIMKSYSYYRKSNTSWQNSIRHNLSLNKAFVKLQRNSNEPGKGAYWCIDDNYKKQFIDGVYKRMKRSKKTSP